MARNNNYYQAMAPPSFADLGKAAKEIFTKGYYNNVFSMDVKTKTQKEVELSASIVSNRDTGKVSGNIESVYKWADYGLTFTEKWNTDNVLSAEVSIEDQVAEGLELGFEVSFSPQTGEKGSSVKAAYKKDYFQLNGDVDLSERTIHGSAVLGCEGWLAGYEMSLDSHLKLTSSNFGFGYAAEDFSFTTVVNDGQEFTGDVYHKVNDKLEAAVGLSWASGTGNTTFGIGGRYQLDDQISLGAKVDNQSNIGLSYTQTLKDDLANGKPKVKITISSLIDAKSISQGGHKIGIGLEFEA